MTGKYSELSFIELKALLIQGKLEHGHMTEEDYSAIIDSELEMAEPNMEILDFCTEGLYQYDEYKELKNIEIDIDSLLESDRKVVPKHGRTGKTRKAILISAAVIAAMLIAQITALAMGYDLFGYIFKWGEEAVVIDTIPKENNNEEPKFYFYGSIDDIPEELMQYTSSYVLEKFSLIEASYMRKTDSFSLLLAFLKDENISLTIAINKQTQNIIIEKDDDYFEEYEKDGIVYMIYKNLDYHKVIWEKDGILYDLGVNLPLEEVKAIIDNY